MKKFAKKILALSVCSALVGTTVHAASYEVIDKGAADTHKYTFAIQENNLGEMVISGTQAYNFSVQYEFLDEDDFDSIVALASLSHEFTLVYDDIEDEEALRAGTPTENDSFWALSYIISLSSNLAYQKYGDVAALLNTGDVSEEFSIFDTDFDGEQTSVSSELTRSTVDFVNGITDNGWIYGSASAPYLPVEIVDDQDSEDTSDDTSINYWLREFSTRGFYSLDRGNTIIPLIAPESTYGGVSVVSDINESGVAIGYASTSISEDAVEFIDESCSTEEQLEELPFDVCLDLVLTNNNLTLDNLYSTEAFKWTINSNGEIENSETLGYLVTPHEDDTRELQSVAQAINDSGVVVGYSHGWYDNDVVTPDEFETRSTYAVVFNNNRVVDINTDHETYFSSRATDINNDDIVVGYLSQTVSGSTRSVFYYADVSNLDNIEAVLPDLFFTGSSTIPRSINENGFVVGSAEVETDITTDGSSRRTHGFMYDIGSDNFIDLNSYLECDSEYTIIDAQSINESNEISATALIRINARDYFGNELIDDTDGSPITEEVVRAVRLQPIANGIIEDCSADEEVLERQGASFGLFTPLVLLLIGFRRRFR
ncbi:DUF3466 family protein [Pseudocolwellia sp. HL-MZ7]|uniref:DUF3466 family protein n=1 Tax=Pseudocolwellia sp. HL-MZ7 TaxID=3400627 RepID=UPI003CE8F90F